VGVGAAVMSAYYLGSYRDRTSFAELLTIQGNVNASKLLHNFIIYLNYT